MDIKKLILDFLIRANLISEKFTGKVIINVNQGGVRDVIKEEKIV